MFAEFIHHRASWKYFPQHFHPRQRNDYLAERQVTCQTCSFDKKCLLFTPVTVFTGDFKSLQIACCFCCENWVLNSCWVWFYNQDVSKLVLQHLVLLNIVGFTHTRFLMHANLFQHLWFYQHDKVQKYVQELAPLQEPFKFNECNSEQFFPPFSFL